MKASAEKGFNRNASAFDAIYVRILILERTLLECRYTAIGIDGHVLSVSVPVNEMLGLGQGYGLGHDPASKFSASIVCFSPVRYLIFISIKQMEVIYV